ncbi:basic helix-loop-helix domain-containing protein [Aspergillus foveolatus]|uniref:basic helix-loop-helix domain-containing protein n=1 Tax=Aspergillus foveolatus TaxID=210207 RepID=UPI003CCD497D
MASAFEPDYRTLSYFPVPQAPIYRDAPYTPPPPQHYAIPSVGCGPAVPFAPYFSQTPFLSSIPYVHNEYDGFVNGVIGDVLIRVDDGFTYKQPYDAKILAANRYTVPESNLMWGSDVSFGPNGYQPGTNSSPEVKMEPEPAPLYGIHAVSHSRAATPTPAQTPALKPESEPETELELEPEAVTAATKTLSSSKEEDRLPELAELSRTGLQKITGKKRRRLLHIIAERNRRLHQNRMYDELYKMVPGLENSSRSTKREVLMRTADFLAELVEGNRRLQQQLRHLQVLPNTSSGPHFDIFIPRPLACSDTDNPRKDQAGTSRNPSTQGLISPHTEYAYA